MIVSQNNQWGVINKTGQVIIPIQYDRMGKTLSPQGFLPVEQNGKWGFIDKTGKVVIPLQYDKALRMATEKDGSNRFAFVELNGERFHIDETGKRLP